MTKICILHASDTHWSSKSDAKQSQIITRLLDDLTAMKSRGVTPDLIVFSGDLVQAGEEVSDFNTAYARLIEPLAASLSLDDERILVCPGNHDIARETVRKQALLEKGLKAQLDSGEAVEEFINSVIAGSEMEALAVRRMANFYSWYDAKFPSCERIGKFCRIRRAYVSGKKVGVALFNTAWRATGEPGELDEGSLILGASVATAAATSLADCDYKIAVLHHPFECHASFDRLLTEKIVAKNFDLLCTGHTHVPNPERTQAVSGSCILSQAGSLYAGSRWYNGYQHVEVDFVHDRTSVYSREYYPVRDEFDASANLLSADPVVFDYAVSDPSAVDQISLFLEKNREIVKDRLVEHINFTNDTIVAEESLLNGYVCPKLFYRGDPVLDESGNVVDSYKKISVEGVLSGPENVAFFGPRQTGKTALKLYLAYQIAYGNAGLPKIPVFIDVKSFQYNLYGLNRALKSLYDVPAKFELATAVSSGAFVFFFEDIGAIDEAGLKRLKNFVSQYSPNRAFAFGCPDQNSISKERHFLKVLTDFLPVGLGELTRGGIRKMAQNWFEDPAEAKANFELVVGQIARDGLPRTAYIVGLLLWAAKQGQKGDRLNEAILLQNVLDHLLGRANFETARRGALTNKGKELLLNRIANGLDENGDSARRVEVIGWVDEYFQRKKLRHDAADVVSQLEQCGILRRDNGDISFRYKCFQEYYIAQGMLNPEERMAKTHGSKFLERTREVELLSGLQGENSELIAQIRGVLAAKMPRDLFAVTYDDFEKEVYGGVKHFVAREKLREIKRTRLTEEQLDQVMEALDERASARGDKPISVSLEETGGDVVRAASERQAEAIRADLRADVEFFRPGTYMAALSILAKVIRNSDYTDYDIKGPALRSLLEEWCRIHVLLIKEVRWILAEIEKHEENPLNEEDFETLVRIFSKILFGVVGSGIVSELSTPALAESLHTLDAELRSGEQLLSLFLLEDCDDPAWADKWKALIEDSGAHPFDIDVLIDRLWRSVNRKALDEDQDRRVVRVVDATEKRFGWSNEKKSSVFEGIRELTTLQKVKED